MRAIHPIATLCAIALLPTLWAPLASAQQRADAAPGPRLLLVEKNGRMALFLPESHIGTPAQDDAYFRAVIRPAFSASSELLAELSIPPMFDRTYDSAVCPDEDPAEAALDNDLTAAFSSLPSAAPAIVLSTGAMDNVDTMRRFIRFYRLFLEVHMRALGQAPFVAAGSRHIKVRHAQSGVLLAGAPRRIVTVETVGTMLHAYCSLPPAQRAVLIAATIAQSKAEPGATNIAVSDAAMRAESYRTIDVGYGQTLSCIRADLQHATPATRDCGDGKEDARSEPALAISRFMIVARGRAWVDGLAEVMQHERLPFYALGAAHFPDVPAGPGLVSMLRAAGYKVTLLRDRDALAAALARLPALPPSVPNAPPAMHTLAGGCRHDGIVYGCEWHDAAVSFMTLNPHSADGQEVWSACFEHDGILGPQKYCTSGSRAAPPSS